MKKNPINKINSPSPKYLAEIVDFLVKDIESEINLLVGIYLFFLDMYILLKRKRKKPNKFSITTNLKSSKH